MTPISEKVLNDLEDLRETTLTDTVSGTSLAITDSDNIRIRKLKLYGDINQSGSPTPDEPAEIETVAGDITVKIDDGDSSENTIELNLGDLVLCGNDTYGRDYLFKKAGKWYKHCLWKKYICTGDEEWRIAFNGSYITEENAQFSTYKFIADEKLAGGIYSTTYQIFCSHLTQITGSNLRQNATVGITVWDNTSNGILICLPILTVEDLQTWLAEQYEAGTPLTICYMLADEIDEEITDETLIAQLEKLYNSKTYKTTTNITTETDNLSPILELEYVLDIKTYIDNKISAIST